MIEWLIEWLTDWQEWVEAFLTVIGVILVWEGLSRLFPKGEKR